jgi:hypothetical protein
MLLSRRQDSVEYVFFDDSPNEEFLLWRKIARKICANYTPAGRVRPE